jgi:hypothetical protein
MSRFVAEVSKVDIAVDNHCCWSIQHMPFSVAKSLEDDTPLSINLSETLGHNVRGNHKAESPRFWLQKEFSFNTPEFRKKTLAPMVARVCIQHGFTSINKGWDRKKSKVVFICSRGRYYQSTKTSEKESAAGRTTKRPIFDKEKEKTTCPFRFAIYWCPNRRRWYIPKQQGGSNSLLAMLGCSQNQSLFFPNLSQKRNRKSRLLC